jgi:hypothetical protein
VDVLTEWANDTTCTLEEANRRAAAYTVFAELIEAVTDQIRWLDAPPEQMAQDAVMLRKADARVREALARVGGEA